MVVKSDIDIENLCNCRDAREWGKICAHAVAVGLHWLQAQQVGAQPEAPRTLGAPTANTSKANAPTLQRDAGGEPAELFLILPPNLDQAIARGKVMLVLEAEWDGGRCPLNALPKGRAFAFEPRDTL